MRNCPKREGPNGIECNLACNRTWFVLENIDVELTRCSARLKLETKGRTFFRDDSAHVRSIFGGGGIRFERECARLPTTTSAAAGVLSPPDSFRLILTPNHDVGRERVHIIITANDLARFQHGCLQSQHIHVRVERGNLVTVWEHVVQFVRGPEVHVEIGQVPAGTGAGTVG